MFIAGRWVRPESVIITDQQHHVKLELMTQDGNEKDLVPTRTCDVGVFYSLELMQARRTSITTSIPDMCGASMTSPRNLDKR
jgi:hypothetical protein